MFVSRKKTRNLLRNTFVLLTPTVCKGPTAEGVVLGDLVQQSVCPGRTTWLHLLWKQTTWRTSTSTTASAQQLLYCPWWLQGCDPWMLRVLCWKPRKQRALRWKRQLYSVSTHTLSYSSFHWLKSCRTTHFVVFPLDQIEGFVTVNHI